MKTWRKKASIPKLGICTVKEFSDEDCDTKRLVIGNCRICPAPSSHGFVNLFHGKKYVGFCGMFYAQKRLL